MKKINALLTSPSPGATVNGFVFGLLDDINIISDPSIILTDNNFWKEIHAISIRLQISNKYEKGFSLLCLNLFRRLYFHPALGTTEES